MTDLERTMGAILSDGLEAFAEAAGYSRNGITSDLTEMVERAEKKSKVTEFAYRCRECGERLIPEEDLIFRDGNQFFCFRHRNPRYDKALFCTVKGCTETPLHPGILCKEHQVEYAFGDLRFGEEK